MDQLWSKFPQKTLHISLNIIKPEHFINIQSIEIKNIQQIFVLEILVNKLVDYHSLPITYNIKIRILCASYPHEREYTDTQTHTLTYTYYFKPTNRKHCSNNL